MFLIDLGLGQLYLCLVTDNMEGEGLRESTVVLLVWGKDYQASSNATRIAPYIVLHACTLPGPSVADHHGASEVPRKQVGQSYRTPSARKVARCTLQAHSRRELQEDMNDRSV